MSLEEQSDLKTKQVESWTTDIKTAFAYANKTKASEDLAGEVVVTKPIKGLYLSDKLLNYLGFFKSKSNNDEQTERVSFSVNLFHCSQRKSTSYIIYTTALKPLFNQGI